MAKGYVWDHRVLTWESLSVVPSPWRGWEVSIYTELFVWPPSWVAAQWLHKARIYTCCTGIPISGPHDVCNPKSLCSGSSRAWHEVQGAAKPDPCLSHPHAGGHQDGVTLGRHLAQAGIMLLQPRIHAQASVCKQPQGSVCVPSGSAHMSFWRRAGEGWGAGCSATDCRLSMSQFTTSHSHYSSH